MKHDEISHFSHRDHKLVYEYLEFPFRCDGCLEIGIGSRFSWCSLCDYDLHTHCAAASPHGAHLHHPFYAKRHFEFLPCPPGDGPRSCNACGQNIGGFIYHCRKCGTDLHPCCAALPHVLNGEGGLRLHLHRRASAPCHRCGSKRKSWTYRSDCHKYNLHVACANEMWLDRWHKLYYGGGSYGDGAGMAIVLGNRANPMIRAPGNNRHRSCKGKVKTCCKLAAMVVQWVIAAVLGDPTALIAGIVSSLL